MSSSKEAGILYREFEKYFKLCTLYLGEPRQLDSALEATKKAIGNAYEDRDKAYFFDIFSSIVTESGEKIFSTEGANVSLAYSLFCEGVRTIVVMPGVSADEIFKWVKKIYEFLKSGNEDDDLATLLWKSPSSAIRVQLYSGLGLEDFGLQVLELDENIDLVLVNGGAAKSGEEKSYRNIVAGEQGWDLPIGDQFLVEGEQHRSSLSEKAVEELKKELKSIGMSDRADRIIPLSKEEFENLREELSNFNLDLIEFNLLNHEIPVIRASEDSRDFLVAQFGSILNSVMDRFHPGLMLFISKTLESFKKEAWARDLRDSYQETVSKTLRLPDKLKIVVRALGDEKRARVARFLLAQAPDVALIPALLEGAADSNPEVKKAVFTTLVLEKDLNRIPEIFNLSNPELVKPYLPLLIPIEFEQRANFLIRLLRSADMDIAERVAENLVFMIVPVRAVVTLYGQVGERVKDRWLRSLLKSARTEDWKDFVETGFRQRLWQGESDEIFQLWVQLVLKMKGLGGMELFNDFLSARVLGFFPKYRREREGILKILSQQRDAQWRPVLKKIQKDQSSWVVQSSEARKTLARLS
jgi:hypothetical protein